jgi:hypothetical protein
MMSARNEVTDTSTVNCFGILRLMCCGEIQQCPDLDLVGEPDDTGEQEFNEWVDVDRHLHVNIALTDGQLA